jgi:hypothetical protein
MSRNVESAGGSSGGFALPAVPHNSLAGISGPCFSGNPNVTHYVRSGFGAGLIFAPLACFAVQSFDGGFASAVIASIRSVSRSEVLRDFPGGVGRIGSVLQILRGGGFSFRLHSVWQEAEWHVAHWQVRGQVERFTKRRVGNLGLSRQFNGALPGRAL